MKLPNPLFHSPQPHTKSVTVSQTLSIVGNLEGYAASGMSDGNIHRFCLRMFVNVGEALLHNAKNRDFQVLCKAR